MKGKIMKSKFVKRTLSIAVLVTMLVTAFAFPTASVAAIGYSYGVLSYTDMVDDCVMASDDMEPWDEYVGIKGGFNDGVPFSVKVIDKKLTYKEIAEHFRYLHVELDVIPKNVNAICEAPNPQLWFGDNGTKIALKNVETPDYVSYPQKKFINKLYKSVQPKGEEYYGWYTGEFFFDIDDLKDFGDTISIYDENYGFNVVNITFVADDGSYYWPSVGEQTDDDSDFTVTAVGQTASALNDDDSTALYTTIRNNGEKSAFTGKLEVSFVVDGKVVDTVICNDTIEPGKSITVKSGKEWKASFGAHTVKTVVKPADRIFCEISSLKQRTNVTDN